MNAKYYVIKKDNVVQEAKNLLDYIVMKLGLDSVINFLLETLKQMLENVTSLKQFEEVKEFFDDVLLKVVVFIDHLSLGKA